MTVASGDEVQVVTIEGSPDGGDFTLTMPATSVGAEDTTGAIAVDATAAAVKTELAGLSSVGSTSNVGVTGPAGGPYAVTFKGDLTDTNVPALTADGSGLTGGTSPDVAVSTSSQGDPPLGSERAYVDISAGGTVANLEVLPGQVPPAGKPLVDATTSDE